MDSFTVCFTGKKSVLRADFMPELTLNPMSNYSCALLDFTSYNSIPNVIRGKNNIFEIEYALNGKTETKKITFETGSYEVSDVLSYIKSQLATVKIILLYEVNVATSKVRLRFDKKIKCTNDSVLNIIGFNKETNRIFEKNSDYWNENIIKITSIDIIRIDCDIVSSSYLNGKPCHTIYQFSNCKVKPGYKFIEVPAHIVYLPIKDKQLRSIQISIVDQDNNLIDFRGEDISCRIHIKKDN